jgi:DNA-binding NarL/FixJ family response regulator
VFCSLDGWSGLLRRDLGGALRRGVGRRLRVDAHRPSARVAIAPGAWLTVSAERLTRPAVGASIAVGYGVASAAERLDLFVRAHGLSARERDVVRAVATGLDTRGVGRALGIAELTVQDHLKAVFARTGAASRADLLARALGS